MSMKETKKSQMSKVRHLGFFDSYPGEGVFLPRVETIPWKEIPKDIVPEAIREAIGFEPGVALCGSLKGAVSDRPALIAMDESGIAWRMEGPIFPDHVGAALDMAEAVAFARTGKGFQRFRVGLALPAKMAGDGGADEILRILAPALRLRTRGKVGVLWLDGRALYSMSAKLPEGGNGEYPDPAQWRRELPKERGLDVDNIDAEAVADERPTEDRVLGWVDQDPEDDALHASLTRVQWPTLGDASLYAKIRGMVPPRVAHEASLSSRIFRAERPFVTVVAADGFTWRFGSEIVNRYFVPAMKLIAAVTATRVGGVVKDFHVDMGLSDDIAAGLEEDEAALQFMIEHLGTWHDLSISVSRPHGDAFMMHYLSRDNVENRVRQCFACGFD